MSCTSKVPPLDEYLARTAPTAHPLLFDTYNRLKADPSVGKTRSESCALGNWGMSTQRAKEAAGLLQTWVDGVSVRVGTTSVYVHLLDLIAALHPADGPPRKARNPARPFGAEGHPLRPHQAEI
jgi:hypothetical protein